MPVYEYGCKKCKREFEYEQRMADPPKKKCEKCGGQLERLISMTSFQLKGSGWYKDLYSSSKPDKSESSSDASSTASESKSESSSDAKATAAPAEKAEKAPAKDADKPKKEKPTKKPAKASSKGK